MSSKWFESSKIAQDNWKWKISSRYRLTFKSIIGFKLVSTRNNTNLIGKLESCLPNKPYFLSKTDIFSAFYIKFVIMINVCKNSFCPMVFIFILVPFKNLEPLVALNILYKTEFKILY